MRTDRQIREQITGLRRELRERKAGKIGTQRPRGATFRGEHEYLVGILAHTRRRLEIFRAAGGEADWIDESDPNSVEEIRPAMCQGCAETHPVGWSNDEAHWHHACTLRKKCDSLACALYVCVMWHTLFGHKRVIRSDRRERAEQKSVSIRTDGVNAGALGDACAKYGKDSEGSA